MNSQPLACHGTCSLQGCRAQPGSQANTAGCWAPHLGHAAHAERIQRAVAAPVERIDDLGRAVAHPANVQCGIVAALPAVVHKRPCREVAIMSPADVI